MENITLDEKSVEKMLLAETVSAIEYHNKKYWVDSEPEISDEEYDLLVRHLMKLAPEHALLSQVHAPVVASSGKVIHSDPMLSLDKAYSLEEVISWAEKFIRSREELLLIQPKYDGISAIWADGVLATRGDGQEGENITGKLPLLELEHPDGIMPLSAYKKGARGEIVIRKDDFKLLYSNIRNKNGRIYKNPRNAVAGIMGLKDISLMLLQHAKLTFVDYTLYSMQCPFALLAEKWESFVEKIEALPYPMDGIVIKLADREYSASLGNTAHHPRGQIAFKFSGVRRETKLLDVQWSFGKSALTPVAVIEPVEIGGTTIQHVSLHNLQNILDRDIHIGDIVTVERAGDVIPYILDSRPSGEEGVERKNCVITNCPSCGSILVRDLPELRCVDPDCPDTLLARLVASVKNIGIEHLGEPNIRKMMQLLQVKSLSDIFALKVEDILKLDGFAEKSAKNLFDEIQNARNVPDWQILASLNIKGIGPVIAKGILKHHTLQELGSLSRETLASLEQIGPERAVAIEKELAGQKEYLEGLLSVLYVKVSKKDPSFTSPENLTICFTGKMPEKRSYYENLAAKYGYEAVDSVTSSLSLLVTAELSSHSSKIRKAEKAGVKVVALEDWLNSLNGPGSADTVKEEKKETLPGEQGELFSF